MMMIKNMPKETLYVSFYQKELTKTTLFELRERLNQSNYNWYCNGKYLQGCCSGYTVMEFRS